MSHNISYSNFTYICEDMKQIAQVLHTKQEVLTNFSCSDLIPYSQAMADKYKQVLPIVTDIWSSFLSQEQRPCKRWI